MSILALIPMFIIGEIQLSWWQKQPWGIPEKELPMWLQIWFYGGLIVDLIIMMIVIPLVVSC